MQLGMVGLGRMGQNMVVRMAKAGHQIVVFDRSADVVKDTVRRGKEEANAEVIGVSSDGPKSHAQFSNRYRLPFVLLSDEKNEVRRLYGVPSTFGVIPGRVTFVIDRPGVVRHIFNSQFSPSSHVAQALRILKGMPN